jgi:hypothetical protein
MTLGSFILLVGTIVLIADGHVFLGILCLFALFL